MNQLTNHCVLSLFTNLINTLVHIILSSVLSTIPDIGVG